MKPIAEMEFHPTSEKLVDILRNKTQNTNPLFFRVMVAYYFALVAANMRCKIQYMGSQIPVNLYAINLATSGSGKGFSTNVIEEQVIDQFQANFVNSSLPLLASQNIPKIALQRAARNQSDPDEEEKKAILEYEAMGPYFFSFDSGTAPAIKDIRHKLLLANAGALNLQIDEIGTNLTGILEVLSPYLELYDLGKIKPKLVKSTAENKRREEIVGRTPANMMAYGTPSRLMNGSKTEEEFFTLLDTGYARRCLFGFAKGHTRQGGQSAEEVWEQQMCNATDSFLEDLSDSLGDLADIAHANKVLQVSKPVELIFLQYRLDAEKEAEKMKSHEDLRKAELSHRYFKALKLAGAYAFIEGLPEITPECAYWAIKLTEESGTAFNMLLTRDRPYVKLAKYIADISRPVTQADLVEDLPFYKGATSQKQEMMQLAIAYGYQNNILIKKAFTDGIEFIRGETLTPVDLNKIKISWSKDIATGYTTDEAAFDQLHLLTQAPGHHWCNHSMKDGHRMEDNAIPGFDVVVLDVDHAVNFSTAQMLLEDYKALFYTTKRHTDDEHRFRIILPMNYRLSLDAADYKEFMKNIFQWLPFEVDDCTGQRARKWLSHPGQYYYQDGQCLDVLPFIPKTSKNEEFKERVLDQQGMDNLERWVINNTGDGNRNNMLLRYAMILVDGGFGFDQVLDRVTDLNDKLPDKLEEAEIIGTIMVSVGKALAKK